MTKRSVMLLLAVVIAATSWAVLARPVEKDVPLPSKLIDKDFWALVTNSSEESGAFHSENLVSNEIKFQQILPSLLGKAVMGHPYVGVGSEQNFTYINAVKPNIAFIVDLRRGNLDLHLLYKAIFELSADRVEFVSRLFSRPKPDGLSTKSTVDEIFAAFMKSLPSRKLYDQNLSELTAHIVTKHGFAITDGDREGFSFIYNSWFEGGPDLRYQLTTGQGAGFTGRGSPGGGGNPQWSNAPGARNSMSGRGGPGGWPGGGFSGPTPTYAELMTTNDGAGQQRSFLAAEENFKFIKDLEVRNLIVPIVGNFAGPKALRAVSAYLKEKKQIVSVFYLSNVEQYLRQDGMLNAFCENAATLPMNKSSIFVRSQRSGSGFNLTITPMEPELAACLAK
jgi:hypothetical protein